MVAWKAFGANNPFKWEKALRNFSAPSPFTPFPFHLSLLPRTDVRRGSQTQARSFRDQ